MGRKLALVFISSLLMVAAVWGNAGPAPLPKDRKVAEPPVRFEGIEQHPDYIFHLSYNVIYGGYTLVEVKDSKAFKLDFKWKDRSPSVYMTLLALERKDFDKRKKDDPSLKWLTDDRKPKGLLEAKLTPPETTVPLNTKEIPLTTYRVTLKEGKLSAEKVEDKKSGGETPTGSLPPLAFGIASSLSMTWLGIWCARRGRATAKPGK